MNHYRKSSRIVLTLTTAAALVYVIGCNQQLPRPTLESSQLEKSVVQAEIDPNETNFTYSVAGQTNTSRTNTARHTGGVPYRSGTAYSPNTSGS